MVAIKYKTYPGLWDNKDAPYKYCEKHQNGFWTEDCLYCLNNNQNKNPAERFIPESTIIRLLRYNGHCCNPCHEDEDIGYAMPERDLGKGRWTELCCKVRSVYDKKYIVDNRRGK